MARRKPADTVHLRLRFPEKLRRRIEAAAIKNQQSMNLEIVERLERSFGQEDFIATVESTAQATARATADALATRLINELFDDRDPRSPTTMAVEMIRSAVAKSIEDAADYEISLSIDEEGRKVDEEARKIEEEAKEPKS